MAKKILVVDDDEKFRGYVQRALESMGHNVLLAEDGMEALEILRAEKPDIMFLDVVMPRMHGYEVCKRVRSDADPMVSHVKIIAVSSKNYSVDKKAAKEAGVDMYLVKPLGLQDMNDAMAKLLDVSPRMTPASPPVQEPI